MRTRAGVLACAIAFACTTVATAGTGTGVATVSIGSGGVTWQPLAAYPGLSLTVVMPDGQMLEKTFLDGAAPSFTSGGGQLPDGQYMWELRVVAGETALVRDEGAGDEILLAPELVQCGTFAAVGGAILDPAVPEGADVKFAHTGDTYIAGSLSIGNDAVDGESMGFDTFRMSENNLRIHFKDTSATASFPTNDWRIIINDSANGGASYFGVEDSDAARPVFKIMAGARSNAIFVAASGRVGFGTSTPNEDLHILYGDTPAIRLDQQGGGWSPQIWDIAGNEASFFIRDATNGSKLPFRIQPGTPTNTLYLKSSGYVGIGTNLPGYPLELQTSGEAATFFLDRADGAKAYINAGGINVNVGSASANNVNLMVDGSPRMTLGTNGYVGIGTTAPGWPVEVETTGEPATLVLDRTDGAMAYINAGGTYVNMGSGSWNHLRLMVNGIWKAQLGTDGALSMANGASCTTGGVWTNSSSRELKDNIEALGADEAVETLAGLDPVKYTYKADKTDAHVGFIAEDVPDLVATRDRKGMSPMDVTAVLTKVVQEQQRVIAELEARLEALEQEVRR